MEIKKGNKIFGIIFLGISFILSSLGILGIMSTETTVFCSILSTNLAILGFSGFIEI